MKNICLGIVFFILGNLVVSGQSSYSEHVTLETDRDIYIAGENIWFHTQCTEPKADSLLSRIIYIELFDQKLNAINRSKFRITGGSSTGHITIPADVNTGNYFLRAYTQYSRNLPSDMICTTLLTIVNPSKPLSSDEIADDENFLAVPAQEKFTTGANSIVLRLTPSLVKKVKLIVLSDDSGDTITTQNPFENGLCRLDFNLKAIPVSLVITINQHNGKEIRKEIPVQTRGISNTEPTLIQNFLSGHKPGSALVCSVDKKQYKARETVAINLPSQKINRPLFISVASDDGQFEKGSLIPWYLAYNKALLANYLDHLDFLNDSIILQLNILDVLYSAKGNLNTDATSGFWLPEMRDAGISGIVRNRKTGKPVNGIMVYASVADEKNQVHLYKTGDDGRFFLTLNHLTGIHNVYVTPGQSDSLDPEIFINSDFESTYPESAELVPFILDSSDIPMLNRLTRNASLCSIYPKYTPGEEKINYYTSLPLLKQEKMTKLSDYIEMPVMTEVFSEIVPFVTAKKKDNHYYMQVFDDRFGVAYNDPLVLFDGIPIFDMDQLMEVSTDKIESVEVTNKTLHLGGFVINGLISIRSKTTDFAGMKLPTASRFIEFHGITEESFPVFPQHIDGETDRNPDFRTLFYWGKTSPGQNTISFSTSDHEGKFTVNVSDGNRKGSVNFQVGQP
ncbi:MAG TPA: hypothetical protein VK179_10380 [Bacteroidales bacterium]|nr:hypothetical protein [Bacteroidales bacterium]